MTRGKRRDSRIKAGVLRRGRGGTWIQLKEVNNAEGEGYSLILQEKKFPFSTVFMEESVS